MLLLFSLYVNDAIFQDPPFGRVNVSLKSKRLNILRDTRFYINDKETNLSDWVAEKGQKYPEALEKFNEYLEQKYDEDVSKLVKEEVELVLYNNRHLVKS